MAFNHPRPESIAKQFEREKRKRKSNLRDEFALKLAPLVYERISGIGAYLSFESIAKSCYELADAMVKESEKYRNREKGDEE